MSAFVHGNDHINLLVTYLATGDRHVVPGIHSVDQGRLFFQRLDPDYTVESDGYRLNLERPARISPDQLGRLLLAQNIRSVLTRYENVPEQELEDYAAQLDRYQYQPVNLSAMRLKEELHQVLIVAAKSYSYQACETEDWPETDAARWINTIILQAASNLAEPDLLDTRAWSYSL